MKELLGKFLVQKPSSLSSPLEKEKEVVEKDAEQKEEEKEEMVLVGLLGLGDVPRLLDYFINPQNTWR